MPKVFQNGAHQHTWQKMLLCRASRELKLATYLVSGATLRWLSHEPRYSFITTPIFYVNAAPHVGHLYSSLLADAAHRWRSMKGSTPAIFSTGTDEHGLKIQKAAASQNKDPQLLCNEVSAKFKGLFDLADISYTEYIRTTSLHHVKRVKDFWETLSRGGHISKGVYSGWYCVSDEAYLTDEQVMDCEELGCKVSTESGQPVEWETEENYIFKLTAFREQLLDWVNTPPYPVMPDFARKLVVGWLQEDQLSDLSVSRPRARLSWGVQVPGDPSQTIYVWLDALLNYLTVSGWSSPAAAHMWPPTEHVVGKDILKFHAVFWPAFLLAAGLQLPQRIVTHSHWIVDKAKMSKSRGNVVDPLEQFSLFGREEVRYYLLKEGSLHHDGNYSMERLVSTVNSDLANTLGNLFQRISSKRLFPGSTPTRLCYQRDLLPVSGHGTPREGGASAEDLDLIQRLHRLPAMVDCFYEDFQFSRGLDEIMQCLYQTNQFLQRWAPWHMIKQPAQQSLVGTVLLVAMESLRLAACLLYPVTPQHSALLLQRLGFPAPPTRDALVCKLSNSGVAELEAASLHLQLQDNTKPLFRKIALKD